MKYWILSFLFVLSVNTHAGSYYSRSIDTFDEETGLYYHSIKQPGRKGLLSGDTSYIKNINIYDPVTKKSTLLFEKYGRKEIKNFIYESSISEDSIDFYTMRSSSVRNNVLNDKRPPKDRLLIGVYDEVAKSTTYYTSDKKGSSLKVFFKVKKHEDWHLDVKNSVIRIVSQNADQLDIRELAW